VILDVDACSRWRCITARAASSCRVSTSRTPRTEVAGACRINVAVISGAARAVTRRCRNSTSPCGPGSRDKLRDFVPDCEARVTPAQCAFIVMTPDVPCCASRLLLRLPMRTHACAAAHHVTAWRWLRAVREVCDRLLAAHHERSLIYRLLILLGWRWSASRVADTLARQTEPSRRRTADRNPMKAIRRAMLRCRDGADGCRCTRCMPIDQADRPPTSSYVDGAYDLA